MVSQRCKMVVKDELRKLGLHFIVVDLGEVEIMEDLSLELRAQLKSDLLKVGLELMDDKRADLVENIKKIIIETITKTEELTKLDFHTVLSKGLNTEYAQLSNLFSHVQGCTIEHFIIAQKIERIKELIIYGALSITEIAWKMNYSSVAHLSNQFKKITGLTPTHFKQLKGKRENPAIQTD